MESSFGADADEVRRRVQELCARFTVPAAHLTGPDWLVLNLLEDSFLGPDVVDGVEQEETLGVRRRYEALLVPGTVSVETLFATAAHRCGIVSLVRQHLADVLARPAADELPERARSAVEDAWARSFDAALDVGPPGAVRLATARTDGASAYACATDGAVALVAGPEDLTDVVEVAWAPAAPLLDLG